MNDAQKAIFCDMIVTKAAEAMIEVSGANVSMIIDRLLTFAAAQAVSIEGSKNTAQTFRQLADRIDAGMFAKFDPKMPARRN